MFEGPDFFPTEYENVRVYLSSPWYNAADALVKDLEYQSPLNDDSTHEDQQGKLL